MKNINEESYDKNRNSQYDKRRSCAEKISGMGAKVITVYREVNELKRPKRCKKYYDELDDFFEYLILNKIIEQHDYDSLSASESSRAQNGETPAAIVAKNNRRAFVASIIVFICNLALLCAKIIACIFSKSVSIISSTLDSAVDILSSAITFFANYKMRHLDVYKHPQGKTRMIPLSIMIISVIMSITSLQVIITSFNRIITKEGLIPEFSIVAVSIVVATIVIKIILFFYCFSIKSHTTKVQAQDSRNDVLSNTAVLVGILISHYAWKYGDSVGAILISVYVLINWILTAKSYFSLLIGKTASAQSLQLYGWVCLLHEPEKILYITTLRAYSFGTRYFVEVDIVLNGDMPLCQAHDIGESLQRKLEELPDVERAFVHLDFEKHHSPDMEHKLGVIY